MHTLYNLPTFSLSENVAIYQIKASKIPCKTQKKLFCFDEYMCIGKTLNMYSCSKFWGNLEGIWGNPHIGWKTPRVYRDNLPTENVAII